MLKNISSVISPDPLWLLASMGHGEDLVLVDRNFPAIQVAKFGRCIHQWLRRRIGCPDPSAWRLCGLRPFSGVGGRKSIEPAMQ